VLLASGRVGVFRFFSRDPCSPRHGSSSAIPVSADERHVLFFGLSCFGVVDDGGGSSAMGEVVFFTVTNVVEFFAIEGWGNFRFIRKGA